MSTMRKVRVDLLEALKERLLSLPPEQFDWGTWGVSQTSCGTVACVAGWACLMSEFQEAGMEPTWNRFGELMIDCDIYNLDETGSLYHGGGEEAFEAVTNLSAEEAVWLCYPPEFMIGSVLVSDRSALKDRKLPIRILSRLIKHYKKSQLPHRTWGERKLARKLAYITRMEAKRNVRGRRQLSVVCEDSVHRVRGEWQDDHGCEAGDRLAQAPQLVGA